MAVLTNQYSTEVTFFIFNYAVEKEDVLVCKKIQTEAFRGHETYCLKHTLKCIREKMIPMNEGERRRKKEYQSKNANILTFNILTFGGTWVKV